MTTSHQTELIVVSGASTGMGAATARDLARRGYHVLAGVRRIADADALRAEGIEPVVLDITDSSHVVALVERVTNDPNGRPLRALVNNAGVSVYAPVEAFPLVEWRRLFEVNFFGHVALIQALLPALIANGGRIVNISSVGGKGAMPTYGPYAATKFALEAASDALRRELAEHGVQVVVVEPGAVQSEMAGRGAITTSAFAAKMRPDLQQRYGALITAALAQTAAHIGRGLSANTAGRMIAEAATTRRPRTRYAVGPDAAVMITLSRFLPDRLLDWVITMGLRPHLPTRAAASATTMTS